MIRVILVDNQRLVLDGIRTILCKHPQIQVAAVCQDIDGALEAYARERPDVCLVEPQLEAAQGANGIERLLAYDAKVHVIALASSADDEAVAEVLCRGAKGYLLKDVSPEELAAAVVEVYNGGVALCAVARRGVVRALRSMRAHRGAAAPPLRGRLDRVETLTVREREVLPLVAQGLSNKEIARALFVTEGTVKNHVSSICRKLGLRSRTEITAFAWNYGLHVRPGESDSFSSAGA